MTTLAEAGESEVISALTGVMRMRSKNVRVGIGDDAAVLRAGKDIAVCTDIVGADRHMPEGMNYQQFGWT